MFPKQCCSFLLNEQDQKKLIKMLKALGNPIRFDIIKFLATHPGCITADIVDVLPISQSTVSQHLKELRDAGWICGTIEGTSRSYCLDEMNLKWFRDKNREIFN